MRLFTVYRKPVKPHTHVDDRGFVVKCYHETKSMLLSVSFYVGITLTFPIEHWLWEHTPLKYIAEWMGL